MDDLEIQRMRRRQEEQLETANAFETTKMLRPLFAKDAYRAGAAWVLDKPPAEVTVAERVRFRTAFYLALHARGPSVIANEFEFTEKLVDLLHEKGLDELIIQAGEK